MHFCKLTAEEAEAGPSVQEQLGLHSVCGKGVCGVCYVPVVYVKRCMGMMWVWYVCMRGCLVCVVCVYKGVGVRACGTGRMW